MASRLAAFREYGPRLVRRGMLKTMQMINYISDRTGLNKGDVGQVVNEYQDAIVFFANNAQSVEMENIAIWSPKINLAGQISLSTRVNPQIIAKLNIRGAYQGEIINSENIGKSMDQLIAMWNQAYPDDPIV